MSPAPATDTQARLAAFYARGLFEYLEARGVNVQKISPQAPWAQPEAMAISPEVSLTAWAHLLERASALLGEPHLPAAAGHSLQLRHLGALGHVLMNCATLEQAYLQLARYIRLLGQIGQPVLTVHGDQAHLVWQWPYSSPAPQPVAMFMLAARARFMRWLSERPDLVLDAHFQGPAPGPVQGFHPIFGGRVFFDAAESKLVFPSEYLQLPVATADEAYRLEAEQRAQQILRQLSRGSPLVQQVRTCILERLASGDVHLRSIASVMGVSARTLQRRLEAQSAHYQEVLDQVRAETARQLLRDPKVPLSQIAFLLGYTEQSSFQTAFRRWTGDSPGSQRRELVGDLNSHA